MTIKVAIAGATGRMGQLASRIVADTDGFELSASIDSSGTPADMLGADVLIDVTLPSISQSMVDFAVENGITAVVGTSGWTAERIATLHRAVAERDAAAVIIVPNFSVGSVLATRFAATAARFYESIEIIEAHHEAKVDSPSGTAVRTAELMGDARAELGPVSAPHTDQRARGQQVSSIPIHSLRMRGVVARQEVVFGGAGEVLRLTHETLAPSAYEQGIRLALRAASGARGVVVGLDTLLGLDALLARGADGSPA